MNGNPFAVSPAGNMTEGLAGIGDVLKDIGDQKREREAQEADEQYQRQTQAAVSKALTPREDGTFDLALINQTGIAHPEYQEMMFSMMGATKEDQKVRTVNRVRKLVNATEDQVLQTMDQNIEEGELAGIPMAESIRERDAYQQADEEGKKQLRQANEIYYASLVEPQELKAWQESRAPKEFKAPQTRTIKSGDREITEELDPTTGEWKEIGNAPLFKPADPEKATAPLAVRPDTIMIDGKPMRIDANTGRVIGEAPSGVNRPLSATAQKELFEAEDIAESGQNAVDILTSILAVDPTTNKSQNDVAFGGGWAGFRKGLASAIPGSTEAADASVDLENKVTGQALESLRAIFGGMPTEGERKILVDLQGSLSMTARQRKNIFERAIQMANKRIKFNQEKADRLRKGEYFTDQSKGDGDFAEMSDDDLLNGM